MTMTKNYLLLLFVLIFSSSYAQKLDLQGHRGARGLYPENSIPGFLHALDLGVTTLEMDVVISKDGKVVVSHEPWFNHSICMDQDGTRIGKEEGKDRNIYHMTYEDIQKYDCGSLGNSRFPEQNKTSTHKPLLSEVFAEVEKHINNRTKFKVNYNIEIKSNPSYYNQYQPEPGAFSELVYEVIDGSIPWNRIVIQSFDIRVLQYLNSNRSDITLAFLVENVKGIDANLKNLGFTPSIYSPYFKSIKEKDVQYLHDLDINLIPWTVNKKEDMQRLTDWGVDGIITDYPDRAISLGLGVKIPYQGRK